MPSASGVGQGVAVHVHLVRAEQAGGGELTDAAGLRPDAAGVRHDERGPFAGRLDLGAHRLERHDGELGQRRTEGEQATAAVQRAVGDPAEVGEALAVLGEVVRGGMAWRRQTAVEEAVAEDRADAGVAQPGDRRVGVLRGVVAV
jgi:hypothetical protein